MQGKAKMDNSLTLHKAIQKGNLEMFLKLLNGPDVDLNYKNGRGQIPLVESIRKSNYLMAERLIEAGCDVNAPEDHNILLKKFTPLHAALDQWNVNTELLLLLIKKGADINAQDAFGRTPLHLAVCRDNLEATSLLLYYGADVTITDKPNCTPFMLTFPVFRNERCHQMLFNFYDDFSTKSSTGDTVLHMDAWGELPIVYDLLEKGADVNCLDRYGKCVLYRTIDHANSKMFKAIWSRMDHSLLVNTDDSSLPFLLEYLELCGFSNTELFECLYLVLSSPVAYDLIKNSINYTKYEYLRYNFLCVLLKMFVECNTPLEDRLAAIYTYLSCGIKIKIDDLRYATMCYGFNEEFQALLYAGDLGANDCKNQLRYVTKLQEDFYLRGFASFSLHNAEHAREMEQFWTATPMARKMLLEALGEVPKFPSLLELSRNAVQKTIQQIGGLTKLYHFYDRVAGLKLPQELKKVLLLEKAIYNC